MKRSRILAGISSLLIPGLGQIYCKESVRGAAILISVIIVGNLNSIFLPLFVLANPGPTIFWAHWLPRILHDVMAFYGIVFWIWQVIDAIVLAKKANER